MKRLTTLLLSCTAIASCGGGGGAPGTCVFGPIACGTASGGSGGAPVVNPSLFQFSATGANVFTTPAREARYSVVATTTRSTAVFNARWGTAGGFSALIGTAENPVSFDAVYLIPANTLVEVTSATGIAWSFTELR